MFWQISIPLLVNSSANLGISLIQKLLTSEHQNLTRKPLSHNAARYAREICKTQKTQLLKHSQQTVATQRCEVRPKTFGRFLRKLASEY